MVALGVAQAPLLSGLVRERQTEEKRITACLEILRNLGKGGHPEGVPPPLGVAHGLRVDAEKLGKAFLSQAGAETRRPDVCPMMRSEGCSGTPHFQGGRDLFTFNFRIAHSSLNELAFRVASLMVFQRSTSIASAIRRRVSSVGFRSPRSKREIMLTWSPAF